MTPKNKAQELFDKFNKDGLHQISSVINRTIRKRMIIKCCLIAVDEIIDALEEYDNRNNTYELQNMDRDFNYWQQVRKEIELIN